MDLYLIRHGDTALGPDGLYPEPAHLSAAGRAQARLLARRLNEIAPHALVTSGVERATETAAPYVSESGVIPETAPGLDEIGIGGLRSLDPEVKRARLLRLPVLADFSEYGGESSGEFAQRVIAALQRDVLERFGERDRVAAVIHGGPIHVILDWADGRSFDGLLTRDIPSASVTLLRHDQRGPRVIFAADTAHLDGGTATA